MSAQLIGLDIAKNVIQVHGVNANGAEVLKKRLKRSQVLEFFANHPPCLIAIEACSGSHYWARRLAGLGHRINLIPAQYVKPFVRRSKTDAREAAAICEAARQPDMPTVVVNTEDNSALSSPAGQPFRFLAEVSDTLPALARDLLLDLLAELKHWPTPQVTSIRPTSFRSRAIR